MRNVEIEFLYLDMSSCSRCVASDASLQAAIALLRPVLDLVGVTLSVRSIQVKSAEQARLLRLVSSPTIRIDGADIAGELNETECSDCTGLSTDGAAVVCRVWCWRGEQYTETPAGLIVDAVLRRVYGNIAPAQTGYDGLPKNLATFFGADA